MLSNCWGWLCPEFRSKRHVFHPFVSQVDKASKPMISVKVPGAVARKKKSPTFFCLNSIKSPFMSLNVYMFHSISRLYSETNMYKGYSWSYLVQRSPRGLYSCNEWENRPRNIAQPKTPLCKVSKMCVACVIFCNHCTFMLQMHSFWLMFTIVYILICEDLYRMYATPPDIDSCSPWFCLINQPFPWQVKGEDKVMAPEEVSSMVLTKMKAPSWVRLGREREEQQIIEDIVICHYILRSWKVLDHVICLNSRLSVGTLSQQPCCYMKLNCMIWFEPLKWATAKKKNTSGGT